MDQGYAVLIAAAMAILGIFYTSRQQRKALRKQHTFQVIDRLNHWDELERCIDFASDLVRTGKVPKLHDECDRQICNKVDFLLNYYEVLASAILCGDVDEELMYRMERGRLTRSYLAFMPYIHECRVEGKTDKTWENLEFITYRWSIEKTDPFDNLIDQFRLRPNTAQYAFKRVEINEFLVKEQRKLSKAKPTIKPLAEEMPVAEVVEETANRYRTGTAIALGVTGILVGGLCVRRFTAPK